MHTLPTNLCSCPQPASSLSKGVSSATLDVPYYDDSVIASLQVERSLVSLDIYTLENARDLPIVVYVHGDLGDKQHVAAKPVLFLDAGFIFVSINHRVAPDTDVPFDCAAAVAWILINAELFGGDARNLFLMGASSGGSQAALVATREGLLEEHSFASEDIRGVVVLDSGALDMELKAESLLAQDHSDDERLAMAEILREISPVHAELLLNEP